MYCKCVHACSRQAARQPVPMRCTVCSGDASASLMCCHLSSAPPARTSRTEPDVPNQLRHARREACSFGDEAGVDVRRQQQCRKYGRSQPVALRELRDRPQEERQYVELRKRLC